MSTNSAHRLREETSAGRTVALPAIPVDHSRFHTNLALRPPNDHHAAARHGTKGHANPSLPNSSTPAASRPNIPSEKSSTGASTGTAATSDATDVGPLRLLDLQFPTWANIDTTTFTPDTLFPNLVSSTSGWRTRTTQSSRHRYRGHSRPNASMQRARKHARTVQGWKAFLARQKARLPTVRRVVPQSLRTRLSVVLIKGGLRRSGRAWRTTPKMMERKSKVKEA